MTVCGSLSIVIVAFLGACKAGYDIWTVLTNGTVYPEEDE